MAYSNPKEAFENIVEGAKSGLLSAFPIKGRTHSLHLEDVAVDAKDAKDPMDIASQYKARMAGESWFTPLYGKLVIRDNATNAVVQSKKMRLMDLPTMTSRLSYIHKGQEYQVSDQWQLKPGVYARRRQNGELEARFNVTGRSAFDMTFDPESQKFQIEYKKANLPAYPILKALGVSDEELARTWGPSVLKANQELKRNATTLAQFHRTSTNGQAPATEQEAIDNLKKVMEASKLRPEVTTMTLGKPFESVTGEALLLAGKKLLHVQQGHPEDDRDAIVFKTLRATGELLHDQVKNAAKTLTHKIQRQINKGEQPKLRQVFSTGMFTAATNALFQSSLANPAKQINPLDMHSSALQTTIMGPGGIKSEMQVTDEAKMINASQFGFIDPLATPEGCHDPLTEVFTEGGWKRWPEVTEHDRFACLLEGRMHFEHATHLVAKKHVGEMYSVETDKMPIEYLVTPQHRMWVRPLDNECLGYRFETAEEMYGKDRRFQLSHAPYLGSDQEWFDLPQAPSSNPIANLNTVKNMDRVRYVDWGEFYGWFLSEGSIYIREDEKYCVKLFQSYPLHREYCEEIEDLLRRMGLKATIVDREEGRRVYSIPRKQIALALQEQGHSPERFIPSYFFSAPLEVRQALWNALMKGDGCKTYQRKDSTWQRQEVYTTTSPRLAHDVERLVATLGFASTHKVYLDKREARYLPVHEVRLLRRQTKQVLKRHQRKVEYAGMVYCATVPGGLLYVRRGGGVPHWSGNSSTGVSLRLPLGVKKIGEQPHIPLYNLKTKKTEWVDPVTAFNHKVVLADQVDFKDGVPHALHGEVRMMGVGNKLESGKLHEADYVMKHPSQIFNLTSAMVPFVGNDSGNRVSMAVRHMEQAISLQGREAPLVQSLSPNGSSFEKVFGHQISHLSPTEGTVTKVTPKGITVQAADGKDHFVHLYDNYPLNDTKSVLHSEPKVKVGDKVGTGQLIADSNYTRDGHLALGKNLKVAYMSYHGKNFEDSLVVTESAAKKLSSIHLHKHELPLREDTVVGLKKFQVHNPGLFTQDQVKHIQEDGVIKVGSKVRPGDPLVLALQPFNIKDRVGLGALRKSLTNQHSDKSIRWEGSQEGEVVAVHRGPEGIQVHVHTVEPLQVADKLCFDEKTEVLTRTGWKPVAEVTAYDFVLCLVDGVSCFRQPEAVYAYAVGGRMVRASSTHVDLLTTAAHRAYVEREGLRSLVPVEELIGLEGVKYLEEYEGAARLLPGDVLHTDVGFSEQPVYCVTVPGHVLYVRRNGKPCWSGNSNRHGGKGVVGYIIPDAEAPHGKDGKPVDILFQPCYDDQTEFLTRRGWVKGPDLEDKEEFGTLHPETFTLEYQDGVTQRVPYQGKMYHLENLHLDLRVTPNHKNFVAKRQPGALGTLDLDSVAPGTFRLEEAQSHFGAARRFLKVGRWRGVDPGFITIPAPEQEGQKFHQELTLRSQDYAEFMGWYVSEGYAYKTKAGAYKVAICQSQTANPAKCQQIRELLTRMGVKFTFSEQEFCTFHKGLYEHVKPLGYAHEKYVPETIQSLTPGLLRVFLDAYLLGDGNTRNEPEHGRYGTRRFCTVSKALMDGLQLVAFKIGMVVNAHPGVERPSPNQRPRHDAAVGARAKAPWSNWSKETKENQIEAWEDYNGVVYCTEVPNHVLVVRRNGKIVISGNCGVGGRMNVGQILETMAGKVAQKTGSTYFVKNFDGHSKDRVEELKKELKAHGLSDTEELTDPKTGLSYGQVLTGPQHFIKLVHQVDKKESVRSGMGLPKLPSNERYDSLTFQPASGDGTGGQSFGQLGLYALLAHGATNILRSAMTYKAQGEDPETNEAKRWKSDHALAWLAMQKGQPLPPPKPTFAYHRFTEMLKGAGINMEKKGSTLVISPLTDKHILEMSKGEISTPSAAVHAKIDPAINHYRPIKGGLFDEKITGGHGGTAWSHVKLAEPLPNPVFEEPIKKVLGITGPRFESILQGTVRVDPKTGKDSPSGITGGAALKAMLDHIEVDSDLKKTKEDLKKATPSAADALYKKARYLQALQKLGMKPSEAYILHNVPILPPKLRPLSIMEDGKLRYEDVNGLYMQMGQMNEELTKPEMKMLPDSAKASLRQNLYDSIKNIYGTGSLPEGAKQKGLLQTIHGTSPKTGLLQKGLLSPRQDMTMRSVIIPGPDLHLDQVGLPKESALTLFRPFVIHQLVKQGTARNENHAQDLLSEVHRGKHDPMVWKALEQVVAERPVLLKRDPALHKYSLQSFYATLVGGSSIKLHPLVTGGFNADHDGDTIIGQVWIKTTDASGYNESVPHTGSVATSLSLIDLKDFPRKEETRTINDRGNIHYDVPEGVTVPAWDGTQMRLLPVVDYSIHPNCEEWQVKTRRGRDLLVSSEHSLAVLDPDTLKVVQRVPRDSGGLCIPVLRQLPETGLLTHIPGTTHDNAPSRTRRMLGDVPLDQEVGWFLGATTGDGWVTDTTPRDAGSRYGGEVKRNMVTYLAYGTGGAEVAEEWKAIAGRLAAGITFQEREMPHTFEGKSSLSFKCAAFSAHLGRWLLPLIGKGAHEKHLPPFFLQAPLAFRRGLFTGLMDTDGTFCWVKAVSKNKPQFQAAYTTVSKQLCEEVMLLALSLGLVPSLTTSEKRGAPVYSIAFSTRTVQEADWLKPAHQAKAAAVEELQKGDEVDHGRGDILPLPARVREEMLAHCREVGATKKKRDARAQQAFTVYTILSQDPPTITRTTFQNFWERVNPSDVSPYLQQWKALCENETVGWDLIESAEPTGEIKEMYDLTIPDAWTFTMDNGAVVWDSCTGDVNLVSTTDGEKQLTKVDLKDFPRLEDTKRVRGSVEIYDVPQNTMVYGMRDSRMELFRVTEYSIHKNLPVWDVLLSSGEKIHCSSDHSLACLDMHTLKAAKFIPNESVGHAVPTLGLLEDHLFDEFKLDDTHVRSATPELGEEIGKFLACKGEKNTVTQVFEQLGLSLSHPEGVKPSSPEGEAWVRLLSEDFLRKAVLYPLAFRQALLTRFLQQRLHQDDSTAKYSDQEGLFLLSRSVGLSCIKRGATLVVYEASSLIQASWFKPQGWRKKARLRGGYFSQVPFPAWVQDECPVKYRKESPQGWLRRDTLQVLLKELEEKGMEPSGYFANWRRMVTMPHLFWERVEAASPTGERRDLYDITVESAQNFLLSTGTLVWDTMSVFVPSTHEEIHDALKMLPSRNIFSDTTGAPAFTPSMESQLGLHRLSKVGDKTAHVFKTHEEVADALARQKVKVNDQVSLAGKMTTPGRVLLASAAPAAFKEKLLHDLSFELTGKGTKTLFHDVGKHSPSLFPTFADEMKQLGYDAATGMIRTPLTKHKVIPIGAHSYSLEDFSTDKATRDKHLGVAAQEIANLPKNLPEAERERQVVDAYLAAINKMTKEHTELSKDPATRKNNLQAMTAAGIKPSAGQYQQMRLLPGIMSDSKGNLIPTPIATSYGEGLDLGAYWIGSYGARSGTVKKVQEVQEPGYMTKLLQNTSMGTLIDQHDCGTRKGILMPVTHSDITDRHLAQDLKLGNVKLQAGALLDKRTLDSIRTLDPGAKLLVRSPLECASEKGVCQKCFGLNANGHHHAMGTNIGVLSAHALGERAVQLTLKAFHCTHEHTAVTCRSGGRVYQTTLGRLFERATLQTVEGEEVVGRFPEEVEVRDAGGWTRIKNVRKHPQQPGTSMALVRTQSGEGVISQSNHPHMLHDGDPLNVQMVSPEQTPEKAGWFAVPADPTTHTPVLPPLKSGWLAGIYCAEGSLVARQEKGAPYLIGLQISQKQDSPSYPRILQELVEEYGPGAYGGCDRYYQLYGVERAKHYESSFGRYSRNKGLPDGWLGFGDAWLAAFVSGVVDGDGTLQPNHGSQWFTCRIDTTSWLLAQQLHQILTHLGLRSRVLTTPWRKASLHQGYAVTFSVTDKAQAVLSTCGKLGKVQGKPWEEAQTTSEIDYVRPVAFQAPPFVYDLETESHTFFANGILTHNSGGAVTGRGGGALGAFQRLEQLTYLPDKTPNSAVLAKVTGKVTGIEHTNTGVQVHIDGIPHFVGKDPTGLDLHTELTGANRDPKYQAWKPPVVGDTVVAGQHLSDPNRTLVNPHRLYEATKDIGKVKEFLASEMHRLYEEEGVRKRAVEVVVRSMGNITKIEDAKDHPDLLRGQFYPRSAVLKINEERKKAGQPLIEHRPTLMGVNLLPLAATEDWLAVLNHQKLRSTLMQNAALGAKSDLHGHHPIPGLIYGAEFGKPKGGTSPY